MKTLIKSIIGVLIFLVILLLGGQIAIYFTIGDKGKVAELGINGYSDVYSVIKTCKSSSPKIEDDLKPTDNNKKTLVDDIKNACGITMLSDDLYLTAFATGNTIVLPTRSINASGGEVAYLYTWILNSLESNNEIKDIYSVEFDVDFKIEGIEFGQKNDNLDIKIILSIPKEQALKNLDSKEKKVLDYIIKNDNIYITIEYEAMFQDNKITEGKNVLVAINNKSYKDSKKTVNIIHKYMGNIENDIIDYNNKILNNLGKLFVNNKELIVK